MTLQEIINAVMLKATGKPTILVASDMKWEKVRGIANYYQQAWANEPGQHWNSLYNRAKLVGTITEGDDEYALPNDVADISTAKGDNIYILTSEGEKVKYQLVDYDDLKNHTHGRFCAKIGNKLVFNDSFASGDPCLGGEIHAPVYVKVSNMTNAEDETAVDIPEWLVTMAAAEYIRNDIVKQNQYGNLIAEANNLMNSMIRNNRAGQVRHIRGSFRNGGGLDYD